MFFLLYLRAHIYVHFFLWRTGPQRLNGMLQLCGYTEWNNVRDRHLVVVSPWQHLKWKDEHIYWRYLSNSYEICRSAKNNSFGETNKQKQNNPPPLPAKQHLCLCFTQLHRKKTGWLTYANVYPDTLGRNGALPFSCTVFSLVFWFIENC